MPIERLSKSFKDISLSFSKNPLTNDIIIVKNETAIARSLRNLVLTRLGEVYFNPLLGLPIMLFENIDGIVLSNIKGLIQSVIRTYEPRVELLETNVELNDDNNEINIILKYNIVGINVPSQQLSFALVNNR